MYDVRIGDALDIAGVKYAAKQAVDGCAGCYLLEIDCWKLPDRPFCKRLGRDAGNLYDVIFVEAGSNISDA